MTRDFREPFKESIDVLTNSTWRIDFDPIKWETKIVNELGQEIDMNALGLISSEIENYLKKRRELEFGEDRKTALDEFTRKKNGITNYILIDSRTTDRFKSVFEAYQDVNDIFCIDKFSVWAENGLVYEESKLYLTSGEAEKLIEPLQKFVKASKKKYPETEE